MFPPGCAVRRLSRSRWSRSASTAPSPADGRATKATAPPRQCCRVSATSPAAPTPRRSPASGHVRAMQQPMQQPTPRHGTIIAVTTQDDSHDAVRKRAASVAHHVGSTVILWPLDAPVSPLESPLPTNWSGEGEQEEFGDRLGPNDLTAGGHEPIARQVGQLREDGVDAWAWLPDSDD